MKRRLLNAMTALRVLIVDDSEAIRRGIRALLEDDPEVDVVCIAKDGVEAVERAQTEKPDVILLDIGLPRMNGIEAARRIRRVAPESKILFLSHYDSWAGAREALNTGAVGYVVKSDAASDLIPGIHKVSEGKFFLSTSLASHSKEIH